MYICSEDDVVSVSVPALLVKTGNGSAESFWHGRIGDGADAEPGRGVSEERGLLRRHSLVGEPTPQGEMWSTIWAIE